jgi:hypothetical protein
MTGAMVFGLFDGRFAGVGADSIRQESGCSFVPAAAAD